MLADTDMVEGAFVESRKWALLFVLLLLGFYDAPISISNNRKSQVNPFNFRGN